MTTSYRTAPHAAQLADEACPRGLPVGANWWVRRHTTRGPQLAHAVPARVVVAYGSSLFTGGRLRWHAQCSRWLRTPDYDTFEIAAAPCELPADWRGCPDCLTALGDVR